MNRPFSPPPRFRCGWPEALITSLSHWNSPSLSSRTTFRIRIPLTISPIHADRSHSARRPPGYVLMRWVPTGYIAGDLVRAWLVHSIGAVATLRAIDVATLVALPLGMYGLLLHSAPAQRGWALVGVLFGFACPLIVGYLNFSTRSRADVLLAGTLVSTARQNELDCANTALARRRSPLSGASRGPATRTRCDLDRLGD